MGIIKVVSIILATFLGLDRFNILISNNIEKSIGKEILYIVEVVCCIASIVFLLNI